MSRYFLQLSYNGKNYNGWQSQLNAPSVQDVVERCLSFKIKSKTAVTGCGRTDAGVHASCFYAHFDTDLEPEHLCNQTFLHQLNNCLPADIGVHKVIPVKPESNARFDAIFRTYHYHLHTRKDPFLNESSFYVYGKLDLDSMSRCAQLLLEYDDFTSFSKLHSQAKTNFCKVTQASFSANYHQLTFIITANRFLRNMVRAIMGTLLMAGKGQIDEKGFRAIIEARDRGRAGLSVPAHALFLQDVGYPDSVFEL